MDSELPQCRFCSLEESNINNLISPCLCNGSMKYVHRECLDRWRYQDMEGPNFVRCRECEFNYTLIDVKPNPKEESERNWKYYTLMCSKMTEDLVLSLIVIFVLSLIYFIALLLFSKTKSKCWTKFINSAPSSNLYVLALIGSVLCIGYVVILFYCCDDLIVITYFVLFSIISPKFLLLISGLGLLIGGVIYYLTMKRYLREVKGRIWLKFGSKTLTVKDYKGRESEIPVLVYP